MKQPKKSKKLQLIERLAQRDDKRRAKLIAKGAQMERDAQRLNHVELAPSEVKSSKIPEDRTSDLLEELSDLGLA